MLSLGLSQTPGLAEEERIRVATDPGWGTIRPTSTDIPPWVQTESNSLSRSHQVHGVGEKHKGLIQVTQEEKARQSIEMIKPISAVLAFTNGILVFSWLFDSKTNLYSLRMSALDL